VKLDLYRDEDGSPRARGDDPGDLLARYLETDVQGSAASVRRLLDLLDRVESGELAGWEETGNAHTLTLAPEGAMIVEWDEDALPQRLSLAELRAALAGWAALLGEIRRGREHEP
jgi:hypothetical protein